MSLVQLANEQIGIDQACRWAGVEVPAGFGNRKTWCPFGITHPDGGREAAMRLYPDTNTAHCFACSRSWTPVSLMAQWWDCDRAAAAEKMCKTAGVAPPTWRDQWEELHRPAVPDRAALAEALKAWCRQVHGPRWSSDQFQPEIAVPLGQCLALLPLVSTAREADEFLYGCKVIMGSVLRGYGE
jgi:hypothetical protein